MASVGSAIPARGKGANRWLPRNLHTSDSGLAFIYNIEAAPGVSDHLYWPGGSSGVTLGAGYDMKGRSQSAITHDMTAIGLAQAVAGKIAAAAGLHGAKAQAFADDNEDLVSLTAGQETGLLKLIIPHYEAIVKRNVHALLTQYEFDALVSFSYNPGGSVRPVARAIDAGHIAAAMNIVRGRIITGGHKSQGLVNRRHLEIDLFLNGNYHLSKRKK